MTKFDKHLTENKKKLTKNRKKIDKNRKNIRKYMKLKNKNIYKKETILTIQQKRDKRLIVK